MINIGARIKELRKQKGISGKELSMNLGFTQSFLSGIENGNKKCSLETLVSICDMLDVSLSDFFAVDNPQIDPQIQRLIHASKKLSKEKLDYLVKFIESE